MTGPVAVFDGVGEPIATIGGVVSGVELRPRDRPRVLPGTFSSASFEFVTDAGLSGEDCA